MNKIYIYPFLLASLFFSVRLNAQAVPPSSKNDSTNLKTLPLASDDIVFTHAEVEAEFPGGKTGWVKFLQKNLHPEVPVENGAPPGAYKVVALFKVDKLGAISNILIEKDPGYGTKDEVKRLLLNSPLWKPAIQNGHYVNSLKRQSVTFQVTLDSSVVPTLKPIKTNQN